MIGTRGYEKLKSAVERDCNDRNHCGCFNPNGCDKDNATIGKYGEEGYKHCFHKYCDKFKWIIDRVQHYSEKTGLPAEEILNSWEDSRDYWYMNYYQDCNQPELTGNSVRVFETVEQLLASIGEKKFRCPACKGISTNPYACNSGEKLDGKTCDWKVYGLFGDSGEGVNVFVKEKVSGETIFMPVSWETQETSVS